MQTEREIEKKKKGKKEEKTPTIYQKLAGEESGALFCLEMAFLGLPVKLEALSVSFRGWTVYRSSREGK